MSLLLTALPSIIIKPFSTFLEFLSAFTCCGSSCCYGVHHADNWFVILLLCCPSLMFIDSSSIVINPSTTVVDSFPFSLLLQLLLLLFHPWLRDSAVLKVLLRSLTKEFNVKGWDGATIHLLTKMNCKIPLLFWLHVESVNMVDSDIKSMMSNHSWYVWGLTG